MSVAQIIRNECSKGLAHIHDSIQSKWNRKRREGKGGDGGKGYCNSHALHIWHRNYYLLTQIHCKT